MEKSDIRRHVTHGVYYASSYTVVVWYEGKDDATVESVEIDGQLIEDPLDGEKFEHARAALDAGVRFACGEIGADH